MNDQTTAAVTPEKSRSGKSKPFQGHRNWNHWNHWNVSLWIGNDEGLYRIALESIDFAQGQAAGRGTKEQAAKYMMAVLRSVGITKTPDGAPYSVTTIKAAMRGM